MLKSLLFSLFALTMLSLSPPAVSADALNTTPDAGAREFDFLIGHWQLSVKPKVSSLAAMIHGAPKLSGSWKAWRAFDGFGIEDELRIRDQAGNPVSLSHNLRYFDGKLKQWRNQSLDVYRGRYLASNGQWREGELETSGQGVDAEGKPYMTRARFFGISADHFQWRQERSVDQGETWEETLHIDATRVGASAPR